MMNYSIQSYKELVANCKKNGIKGYSGKNKQEIIDCFGQGFNYYPDNYWFYNLKKCWWGRKKALLVIFGKEGRVKDINIKTYYFLSSIIPI